MCVWRWWMPPRDLALLGCSSMSSLGRSVKGLMGSSSWPRASSLLTKVSISPSRSSNSLKKVMVSPPLLSEKSWYAFVFFFAAVVPDLHLYSNISPPVSCFVKAFVLGLDQICVKILFFWGFIEFSRRIRHSVSMHFL